MPATRTTSRTYPVPAQPEFTSVPPDIAYDFQNGSYPGPAIGSNVRGSKRLAVDAIRNNERRVPSAPAPVSPKEGSTPTRGPISATAGPARCVMMALF